MDTWCYCLPHYLQCQLDSHGPYSIFLLLGTSFLKSFFTWPSSNSHQVSGTETAFVNPISTPDHLSQAYICYILIFLQDYRLSKPTVYVKDPNGVRKARYLQAAEA